MCYDVFKESAEIDVRARKMCSLKLGSKEKNKENDNSGDDVRWMLKICSQSMTKRRFCSSKRTFHIVTQLVNIWALAD